ncbi:MAG TPA: transcriptional regulator GcvA [Candidatus Limnocylindrales bacterium]|nr:transcriptional regulator GcvA [Candidatus Limnocylindrales bacterium]
MPRLGALEAFEAAGRLGSFQAAASALHVTPSAISRQIQALEDDLGVPLFHRLHRGVRLTDEGAVYLREVQTALSRIVRATERLVGEEPEGRLRLSVLPSFAGNWLLPRLHRFESEHPRIAIEMRATTDYADFERDDVDAAIRFGAGPWAGLHSEPLLELRFFPVCAPEIAAALHEPRDLASQRLLHELHVPDAWSQWLAEAGVPDLRPRQERAFDNAQLVLDAAAAAQGVALSTHVLVHRQLAEGRLVKPFPHEALSDATYHFVCRRSDLERPAVRALARWLRDAMAEPLDCTARNPA